jgi:hypothetical protein
MYIGVKVQYPLFLSNINDTSIFQQIFEKNSNIKFNESASSGCRVVPCGQTDRPMVTFLHFSKTSTKSTLRKRETIYKCCQEHVHQPLT